MGLAKRIIPCLDVRDGRVVKGVRFENLRDQGDPAETAARTLEAMGREARLADVAAAAESARHETERLREALHQCLLRNTQ